MNRLKNKKAVILFIAVIFLVLHGLYYFNFLVDDVFISFRYAENLVSGHGLVFNVGERVEGYSNFLYVLIVSGFIKVFKLHGLDLLIVMKVFGLACSVFTLIIMVKCHEHSDAKGYYWLPAALLIVSPFFALWSVGGLETAFFSLLLISAVYFYLRERETESFWVSAVLFGLLSLTRPEGCLYFIVAASHRLIFDFKGQLNSLKFWRWVGVFLLVFIPFIIWRFYYYGNLLPNTFYAKTSGGVVQYILGSQRFLRFIRDSGGLIFYAIVIVPALRLGNYYRSLLLSLIVASCFFGIYVGGDWMNGYRFFCPFLPLAYLLFLEGTIDLNLISKGFFPYFLAILLATNLAIGWDSIKSADPDLSNFYRERKVQLGWYFEMGEWLKKNTPVNSTIALGECGIIPYVSERRVIDFFGLVDPHIARLKGLINMKTDVDYVLGKKPDYILTASEKYVYNKELQRNRRFNDDYMHRYDQGQFVLYSRKKED